jgi:hypothetical protein
MMLIYRPWSIVYRLKGQKSLFKLSFLPGLCKIVNLAMANPIPFDFVLDYLPHNIIVKPMFGMHYIYLGKKIMLILRNRINEPELNGVWLATNRKHHESLKEEIQELGPAFMAGDDRESNWLFVHPDNEGFEEAVISICGLITHGDARVGNVTQKPPA